jgi:hypothetical protein
MSNVSLVKFTVKAAKEKFIEESRRVKKSQEWFDV